jgi:hypothetical protein
MCGFFLLPHVEVNIMDRVWILLLATGHTTLYPKVLLVSSFFHIFVRLIIKTEFMVNNSTNINKTNDNLSPQTIEHSKTTPNGVFR